MVGVVDTARQEGWQVGRQEGREEGRQEGREEGRQEGRRDEKLTIAQAMKRSGSSLDFIAQVTGLSLEDLQAVE